MEPNTAVESPLAATQRLQQRQQANQPIPTNNAGEAVRPASATPAPTEQAPPAPTRGLLDRVRRRNPFAPTPTPPGTEATGPGVTARRQEHMVGISNLPALDSSGREVQGGVRPPETVGLSKEVIDGLRGFTASYTQRLIAMKGRDITVAGGGTNAFDQMKAEQATAAHGQSYAEDKFMLDLFTQTDPQTGEITLKSNDEINSLITTYPQMQQSLMIIAERDASDILAAAGLRAELRGAGQRSKTDKLDRTIDLPIDQGVLNLVGRRAASWLSVRGITATGVGTGIAAAGFAVGGPAGSAVAVGGEALTAIIGHSLRNGVRIRLQKDDAMLARAKRPEDLRRAKDMLGINPTDPKHSESLERSIEEAIQIIYLRAQYLTDLGVPAQKLDALSDQFLKGNDQRFEEIDETTRRDIGRRYEDLGGRNVGAGVIGRLDVERDIFRRAQNDILVKKLSLVLQKENRTPAVDRVAVLGTAITARGAEGASTQARTKEARDEQARLAVDRTALGERETPINAYQEKLRVAAEARRTLSFALEEITDGANPYADYAATVNALRQTMGVAGPDIEIPTDAGRLLVHDVTNRRNAILAAIAHDIALVVPLAGENSEAFRARRSAEETQIRDLHQPVLDQVNRERTLIQEAITRLQSLQQAATIAEQEAAGQVVASAAEVTAGTQALTEIHNARERIAGGATPWVNPATLNGGDYNAILAEINAAHVANPVNGWAVNENNVAENRLLVREAIAQARADIQMDNPVNIPNAVALKASFTTVAENPITTRRITPVLLRALTIDELVRRDAQLAGLGGAITPRADLEKAKEWANAQVVYMQRAFQEENRNIQNAETIQARTIRNVDSSLETAQLTMVKNVLENPDKVRSRALAAFPAPGQEANLTNVNIATTVGVEGYTRAEEDSGLPRNILEILHIATNYQDEPDRNIAFQQIWRNLGGNSDLLTSILKESFKDLDPAGIALMTGIGNFSLGLKDAIETNGMDAPDFLRGITKMNDVLFNWSRTI